MILFMCSRRRLLAVGLSVVSTGCMADIADSSHSTTTVSSSAHDGNPPPWGREGSEMDIGVENELNSEIKAVIEVGEYRKEVMVNSGATWVSENVIESGATPTVMLTVDDSRRKEVTWKREDENEGYILFEVTSEQITYRMSKKGTVNRTQVTDSPRDN